MRDIKISIVQTSLFWENIDDNLTMLSDMLSAIKIKTDLIVLPEMFTTGFTMNAKSCAESPEGKAVYFLKRWSQKKKSHICGSVVIKENNNYYNRLFVVSPDGIINHYDKRHLFRMAKEHHTYTPGRKKLILKIKGWRIAFFICYDLRFPVWCRNRNDYDAAVFVANWPERRSYHWKNLLLARAIENQSYVIGVNRVGLDGNKINYSGDSAVINPLGEYLSDLKNKHGIFSVSLNYKDLENYRKKFPVHKDADKFKIL